MKICVLAEDLRCWKPRAAKRMSIGEIVFVRGNYGAYHLDIASEPEPGVLNFEREYRVYLAEGLWKRKILDLEPFIRALNESTCSCGTRKAMKMGLSSCEHILLVCAMIWFYYDDWVDALLKEEV